MTPIAVFFLHFFLFLSMVQPQDFETHPRSHGLGDENPVPFSPSTFEFFHPNSPLPSNDAPCAGSACAPLPLSAFSSTSAEAKAAAVKETTRAAPQTSGAGVGAGGIAGIVFGCVLVALLAMGAYHVAVKRRANISRAKAVQPNV